MRHIEPSETAVELYLRPESALERQLVADPAFQEGLYWGKPRFGHPEGQVIFHLQEVLANVDKTGAQGLMRERLRLITLAHDTFKYQENAWKNQFPRDWSKHHAVLARQFMEHHTQDQSVLDVIEWHDEAYYSWRTIYLYMHRKEGEARLGQLLQRLGDNLQLYYLFFKCDTRTGDKNQAPLKWFEQRVEGIELVDW